MDGTSSMLRSLTSMVLGLTGVNVTVAAKGIHNNNSFGHGWDGDEILIERAAAGVLVPAKQKADKQPELEVVDSVQVGSTIDNPSYFADPFAAETGQECKWGMCLRDWPERRRFLILIGGFGDDVVGSSGQGQQECCGRSCEWGRTSDTEANLPGDEVDDEVYSL
jgi:hypothetical protein